MKQPRASMNGRCACGETILVNGTLSACVATIREWRSHHKKPECRPVTKEEQRKLKRARELEKVRAVKAAQAIVRNGNIEQPALF